MSTPLPQNGPLFATPRLLGRCLQEQDLPAMLAVYGDELAMQGMDDGEPLGEEDCARWLALTQENYRQQRSGLLALVRRGSGDVVGFCGLLRPEGEAEVMLQFALRRDCWRQGYASEMLPVLLDWGEHWFGFSQVIAINAPENTVARRVLEKAGMRYIEMRAEDDGRLMDAYVWNAEPASA